MQQRGVEEGCLGQSKRSSFMVMTCFRLGDYNILPKKELHRSLQVRITYLLQNPKRVVVRLVRVWQWGRGRIFGNVVLVCSGRVFQAGATVLSSRRCWIRNPALCVEVFVAVRRPRWSFWLFLNPTCSVGCPFS